MFCEGTSKGRKYKDSDAQIYGQIFSSTHYDTEFISIGSSNDLENIDNQSVRVVSNILKTTEIIKFVDRDDKSPQEIQELLDKGIKTSKRRHIECYLFDDEIISKLCNTIGQAELIEDCLDAKKNIKESVNRGIPDDIKSASGTIYNELKRILNLTQCGNNTCAFIRDMNGTFSHRRYKHIQGIRKEIFDD